MEFLEDRIYNDDNYEKRKPKNIFNVRLIFI